MKHLVRNWKAMSTMAGVIMLAVILIASAFIGMYMFGVPNFNGGNNNSNNLFGPTASPVPASGQVSVFKTLTIIATNIYGGGALTGTSAVIQVYEQDGVTKSGAALSLSSSSCTTALSYQSGTHLVIGYTYSTTDIMYWNVVVPTMSASDAQALTTNSIHLEGFNIPTLTDSTTHSNGTVIADTNSINVTTASTGSLSYSWHVAAVNTGYLTSHDASYNTDNLAVVWATVSGTGYTSVSLSGFGQTTGSDGKIYAGGKITKGTTDYYYKVIDPTTISMYKVGNNYVLQGTGSFTFGYVAVGYTGIGTTIQLYLKVYSDPAYMQSYGTYGPYSSELAENTITVNA